MTTVRDPKCICGGELMPVWRNDKWFCTKCNLEQILPKEQKPVDSWDK